MQSRICDIATKCHAVITSVMSRHLPWNCWRGPGDLSDFCPSLPTACLSLSLCLRVLYFVACSPNWFEFQLHCRYLSLRMEGHRGGQTRICIFLSQSVHPRMLPGSKRYRTKTVNNSCISHMIHQYWVKFNLTGIYKYVLSTRKCKFHTPFRTWNLETLFYLNL